MITLGFNHSSATLLYFLLYRLTLIDHPLYLIQVWNCAYFTRESVYWGKKEYICCHSGKQGCHIVILCIFVLNSCLSCRSCTPLRTKSPGWKIIHHHPAIQTQQAYCRSHRSTANWIVSLLLSHLSMQLCNIFASYNS